MKKKLAARLGKQPIEKSETKLSQLDTAGVTMTDELSFMSPKGVLMPVPEDPAEDLLNCSNSSCSETITNGALAMSDLQTEFRKLSEQVAGHNHILEELRSQFLKVQDKSPEEHALQAHCFESNASDSAQLHSVDYCATLCESAECSLASSCSTALVGDGTGMTTRPPWQLPSADAANAFAMPVPTTLAPTITLASNNAAVSSPLRPPCSPNALIVADCEPLIQPATPPKPGANVVPPSPDVAEELELDSPTTTVAVKTTMIRTVASCPKQQDPPPRGALVGARGSARAKGWNPDYQCCLAGVVKREWW